MSADDARVAYPLFQAEYGGSTPTSALQLRINRCSRKLFKELNEHWHSRLPSIGEFYVNAQFFAAECNNIYYAVAGWSEPIALEFNNTNTFELRRFAIAPDAPKNTASRMLSIMVRLVHKERPELKRLVSYQDTAVHTGTIYKACGWRAASKSTRCGWLNHARKNPKSGGSSRILQSDAPKIRWELNLA